MRMRALAVITLLIMFTGCSTKAPLRTPGMEAVGVADTTAELRLKVYNYESVFATRIQSAADDIFQQSSEQPARENAIRWKLNVVPVIQTAVFQLDPLAGLADAWGLTEQMYIFFSEGNGKELFWRGQDRCSRRWRRWANCLLRSST